MTLRCSIAKLWRNIILDIKIVNFSWIHFTKTKTMNKMIFTQDSVFMAVVVPSGCGKTELIFKMLSRNTFYPKYNNIIFLYREMQQIYTKMEKTLGVMFKKYANLEFLNSLANCLLIIDDSCEEIYNDREFAKLATAGHHKNNNVIYIKHNIYQQSKWSRTTDLKTTLCSNQLAIFHKSNFYANNCPC